MSEEIADGIKGPGGRKIARRYIRAFTEEPTPVYDNETGEPALSWMFEIRPACDPADEPYWSYAAAEYQDRTPR